MDWLSDREENFDFLSYSHNGLADEAISGEDPWQEVAVELAPGRNQLTWTYRKDDTISEGSDFGSVSRLRLAGYADHLIDQGINHYSARPDNDPDGNGLPLILEYAFGIAAGEPGRFPEVRFLDETGQRVLEFEAPEPPSDVAYVFEKSINLEPRFWRKSPGLVKITPLGDLNRYRLPVTFPRPMKTSSSSVFALVSASRSESDGPAEPAEPLRPSPPSRDNRRSLPRPRHRRFRDRVRSSLLPPGCGQRDRDWQWQPARRPRHRPARTR